MRMQHEEREHPERHLHQDVGRHHRNHRERGAHHDRRENYGRDAPHEAEGNRGYGEREPRGRDAAGIRPFLIPDYELLPRDDSGGPEYQPYTAEFGDGGYVTGEKKHLSAHGGRNDRLEGDEQESTVGERNSDRGSRGPRSSRRETESDR